MSAWKKIMRRRTFISFLAGAAAWPLAVRAQGRQPRRIGILMGFDDGDVEAQSWVAAFREDLQKLGWIEGRNVEIITRWAKSDAELMNRSAREIVAFQPDFILTGSTPAAGAMLQQTRTIPIVFLLVADPIGNGYVASLPRPGGNITGFTPIQASLGGKWAELLKDMAPRIAKITFIYSPQAKTYVGGYLDTFKAAAAPLGVEVAIAAVNDISEVDSLMSAISSNGGLVVMPDTFTVGHRAEIAALASRYRVPSIFWSRSYAELGGLISYGPFLIDEYRRAAAYADRILKGEKPSELPVQTPNKFELVINTKTAKALGLTTPDKLRVLADDILE
jgi:putative ABC transport system substrate-binding protein